MTETVAGAAVPLAFTLPRPHENDLFRPGLQFAGSHFVNVEATAVTVDGNLRDWVGVNPVVNDPADTPDTVDILVL